MIGAPPPTITPPTSTPIDCLRAAALIVHLVAPANRTLTLTAQCYDCVTTRGMRQMTFQAYLDNIQKQTGLAPNDFVKLAAEKGLTRPGTKATQITDWLKADYGLGHGHAMAIVKLLKDRAGLK
jgi:hypothetical protein